jgi:hypothetical protein
MGHDSHVVFGAPPHRLYRVSSLVGIGTTRKTARYCHPATRVPSRRKSRHLAHASQLLLGAVRCRSIFRCRRWTRRESSMVYRVPASARLTGNPPATRSGLVPSLGSKCAKRHGHGQRLSNPSTRPQEGVFRPRRAAILSKTDPPMGAYTSAQDGLEAVREAFNEAPLQPSATRSRTGAAWCPQTSSMNGRGIYYGHSPRSRWSPGRSIGR